jgi:hypothetical protein
MVKIRFRVLGQGMFLFLVGTLLAVPGWSTTYFVDVTNGSESNDGLAKRTSGTVGLVKKLILFLLLLHAVPSFATTHYVSYTGGSDSNTGLSEGAAWKHAPGMLGLTPTGTRTGDGCSANCASYTPVAGDLIILEGGVVWPYTVAPWTFTWSGSGSTSVYGCQGSGCIYVGNAVGAGLSPWNAGVVTNIWLKRDLGGWSPSSPPSVFCSGGGGSGAAATVSVVPSAQTEANIAGFIYNISLASGGSNYTSAPTCTLSGGSGTATLGADIDRAIVDWGKTQSSPPDWPLGICGTYSTTCVPGIQITGNYVIASGIEARNMLTMAETGSGTNDEEQGVFFEVDGSNVTVSNSFAHGAFSDCVSNGNCNSIDVNHHAIDLGSPNDEAANNVVENGDAGVLGTSSSYCGTNNFCSVFGFGIGTGTQSGQGPVSVHGNVLYMNSWQLRFVGTDASGSNPYLSYNNEMWLVPWSYNTTAHINSRYMQLQEGASLVSYNNIVHNQVSGCSSQIQCSPSMTLTYYNEVSWALGGGTESYSLDMADASPSGGCTLNLYNDTADSTANPTGQSIANTQSASSSSTVVMQNLHGITGSSALNPFWITASGTTFEIYSGSSVQSTIQASSVIQTESTANGQGYAVSDLYAPTASSNASVTFNSNSNSANLTSLCTGYLTALCSDINGNARPTTGGWQAGAYNFAATVALSPPSNLKATPY